MKNLFKIATLVGAGVLVAAFVGAPKLDPAPSFTLKSADGKNVNLSDFKGKYVVLEWWNNQCPFVKKHYDSGGMQATQKELTKKGVVWLTICSSAEGKEGYVSGLEAKDLMKSKDAAPSFVLLDPSGAVGHAYKARTTPHMFLISPKGEILYNGAIDDRASKNYVKQAYSEASAGKPVTTPATQPYGCSIKYAN